MEKLVVVGLAVLFAVLFAMLLQRRRPAPPSNPGAYNAPAQLDRSDFDRPEAPWLVVSFTSETCHSCADVAAKCQLLESAVVAVQDIEVGTRPDLHGRYAIEAVPIVAIADSAGVVRRSFVGPVSSTHLWGAVAELREPGSVPDGCGAATDGDAED